jgi:hypothetical protein
MVLVVAQLGFGLTIDSGLPVAINERHPDSFRDSACIVDVLLIVIAVNLRGTIAPRTTPAGTSTSRRR